MREKLTVVPETESAGFLKGRHYRTNKLKITGFGVSTPVGAPLRKSRFQWKKRETEVTECR